MKNMIKLTKGVMLHLSTNKEGKERKMVMLCVFSGEMW